MLVLVLLSGGCTSFTGESPTSSPEGGVDAPPADAGSPSGRYMFVTSETYRGGEPDGLVGADKRCAALADSNPKLKGRLYKAWLSHASEDVIARFSPRSGIPIVRVDDANVAADLGALLAGSPMSPVNVAETGRPVSPTAEVWTGTGTGGRFARDACSAWRQSLPTAAGAIGDPNATNGTWTDNGNGSCDVARHLYCLEN